MKRSQDKKEQGHRGDKDTNNENLMNNKILSLIFVSFTKLKMPVQNKVLREGEKKKKTKI